MKNTAQISEFRWFPSPSPLLLDKKLCYSYIFVSVKIDCDKKKILIIVFTAINNFNYRYLRSLLTVWKHTYF